MVSETLYHNDSETEEEETFFYLLDGNGDIRALADEAGNVTDTYRFDAFGIKLIQTGNTKNPYGYRSEETDELTGFVYLRARYMNPATGTFISEDTFGGVLSSPITLNRYAYAGQNPVSYIDPSGHFFTVIQQVLTMTLQEMIKDKEGTISSGRIGGMLGVMGAIANGDTDLEKAYVRGVIDGIKLAGLGKLKALGQGIKAAKQMYMVYMLTTVFKNWGAAAIYASQKEYSKAAICGAAGLFGMFEFVSEYRALQSMNTFGVKATYEIHTNAVGEGGSKSINDLKPNQGYSSFKDLKKNIGSAGDGNDWHHIVEQSQIKKSGFSPEQIHNTNNIIAVDHATHMRITGYYNTKSFDFTNGLSVRDWLAGQSYEELVLCQDLAQIKMRDFSA